MSVRFRPYDPERRFVCPLPFAGGRTRARWLSLHVEPPDWIALFSRACDLMLIEVKACGPCDLTVGNNAGHLCWRQTLGWTIIELELAGMSEKKQTVVRTALLKAARYTR
jgi:hypothetical protein